MPTTISAGPRTAELAAQWWVPVLRGVVAILFGLIALLMPGLTIAFLLGALAAFLAIDGVLSIVTAFRRRDTDERWWVWLLEGVLSIALAVMAIALPIATAIAFVYWIAAWAVIVGIMRIVAAISLRREIEGEWAIGLSGALSILLGVLMFVMPGAGLLSIAWLFGVLAILLGATMVAFGFRLRGMRQA